MSTSSSKLPNLDNLKLLNDLLEELENLKKAIENTTEEKRQLVASLKLEEKDFKEKAQIEGKKRISLEFIENKIIELRDQEKKLWEATSKSFDKNIENYFSTGKLTAFLDKLLKKLTKEKIEFVVLAGKSASKYLPTATRHEEYSVENLLRVETPEKIYIFDLDDLKVNLKTRLLREKLPQSSNVS